MQRRPGLRLAHLGALLAALAGCASAAPDPGPEAAAPSRAQAAEAGPERATRLDRAALPVPEAGGPAGGERNAPLDTPAALSARDAPDVYMALQPDSAGTVSVVFAIDSARDGPPSDDPAIRITPEGGRCNPQELSHFNFTAQAEPVFGRAQARAGVEAWQLPNFMAIAVSTALMRRGLAATREATRPHNVCTRKLWERVGRVATAGALAGQ